MQAPGKYKIRPRTVIADGWTYVSELASASFIPTKPTQLLWENHGSLSAILVL